MDERLNQQNIIELLIEKNGLDRKTAEKFVKEFFLLIEDSLEKDKIVKIKGLGTFKLIQVESRESVNINTGDRFVIEGYNKITFTPDSNIKNSINQPFAHFETVELNENTVIDDIETEEENGTFDNEAIEDVLEDNIPEATPSEDSNIEIVEIGSIKPESDVIIDDDNQPIDPEPTTDTVIENFHDDITETDHSNGSDNQNQHHEKKSSFFYKCLIALIIIVVLTCGGIIGFIYYPDFFEKSSYGTDFLETEHKISVGDDAIKRVVGNNAALVDTIKNEPIVTKIEENKEVATVPVPDIVVEKAIDGTMPDSINYDIIGTKTVYTVKNGETLTRVSLRFYGTKNLWPYIVKHNRNRINNPNNVAAGTELIIPELNRKNN